MKKAIKLGVGEPYWNADGTMLGLMSLRRGKGAVVSYNAIRPRRGFKSRHRKFAIYAVPVGEPK